MRFVLLGSLADLYFDELEGSLVAEYAPRDPLAEFILGRLSPRALRVMVESLPPSSTLARARAGNSWTDAEWIAHDTNWQLRQLIALTYNVNSEKGKSAPEPKPLPTPLDEGTVVDAAEVEYRELQRSEMDQLTARMFPHELTE